MALGCVEVVEQREKTTQLARKHWVSSSKARKVVEDNDSQSSSEEEEESDAEEKADIVQALDELRRAREDAALRPGCDGDFITVILRGGWKAPIATENVRKHFAAQMPTKFQNGRNLYE